MSLVVVDGLLIEVLFLLRYIRFGSLLLIKIKVYRFIRFLMDLISPLLDCLTVDDFDPICQLHEEFGVLNPLGLHGGEPTDGEGRDGVVIKRHFEDVGG